ncbi:MAG: PP2C family protein-serine/threonine phosphatase [Micromonosporaceae bacterium]
MGLTLRAASASHLGLVRNANEDSVHAGQRLFAVADGVGGQPAGEVASDIVITALATLDTDQAPEDPLTELREQVDAASRRIRETGEAEPDQAGMATTVTALLWAEPQLALIHVGDSRGYRLRDGALTQLTVDHTYVQWLVDQGMLTPEDAQIHPQRSIVTQVVQGDELSPIEELLTPEPGDRYLLCSDGLSDVVRHDEIEATLSQHADLEHAVEQLIKLALRAGAPDNVSVVLIDVAQPG